jgi:hypothetical protein
MTAQKAQRHRECCSHSLINVAYPTLDGSNSFVIVELKRNHERVFMCIRCGDENGSSLEMMAGIFPPLFGFLILILLV